MSKNEVKLSEKFSLNGNWWQPGDYENRIPGTLSFDPTGKFELEITFNLNEKRAWLQQDSFQTLHGIVDNNDFITILGASKHSEKFMGSSIVMGFLIRKCLIGNELIKNDTKFQSAKVYLSHLPEWMGYRPFADDFSTKVRETGQGQLIYSQPKPVNISIPALEAKFSFTSSLHRQNGHQKQELHHKDFIIITPNRKQDLHWFSKVVYFLQLFLILVIVEPVLIESFGLCVAKRKYKNLDDKKYTIYNELCFKQAGFTYDKKLSSNYIPFKYQSLRNNLRNILNRWFSRFDKLSIVHSLYFGLVIDKNTTIDSRFLLVMQALESYHRVAMSGEYLTRSQYKKVSDHLTSSIPPSVPSDLKTSLKSRIKFGNEYSLRKRMKELYNLLPQELHQKMSFDSQFIQHVVETRNYLTHRFDPGKNKNILDDIDRLNAVEKLMLLLQYFLLKESGIHRKTIVERMLNDYKYRLSNWRL